METPKPNLHLPPIDKMTYEQIETMRMIARNHNKLVSLNNGLAISPTGDLTVDFSIADNYK